MDSILSNDLLLNAAEQFDTPLYVYDAQRIRDQYQKLVNAFHKSDVHVFYACKALTNVNVLKVLNDIRHVKKYMEKLEPGMEFLPPPAPPS